MHVSRVFNPPANGWRWPVPITPSFVSTCTIKRSIFSSVRKPVLGGSENGTEVIFVFIELTINAFLSYKLTLMIALLKL